MPMMPKGAPADVIVRKLYALDVLAHTNHVNTRSYAAHNAFGGFYDYVGDFKDKFIEYLMGESKIATVKTAVIEVADDIVGEADAVSKMLYDYGHSCNDEAIVNMAADFEENVSKLKYMLMLK